MERGISQKALVTDSRARILRGVWNALTLVYDDKPSETALHLGAFDNPERYEPRSNYGVDQRLGWICSGVDLPGYRTEESW